jgi:threonyl-tRNA synthetase
VLAKRELYDISGHWAHYRDDMYPPMEVGGEQVVLRPSLCPHHALIYRSRGRSYRELPLRMAELGGMHRSERSGVLGGLTRVRSIQLNDAHIFCTQDQVADEAVAALGLIRQAYRALGIEPVRYRLSLAGPSGQHVGSPEAWDQAAAILADVLARSGIDFEAEPGKAAFYGPKIDVQVADSAERETTLSTVQVDFYQPERFGLQYIGPDGGKHRPVMVHRSVIGSAERAVAHLIDVHGGAFPGWLAPVQLAVLPITGAELAQAQAFMRQAVEQRIRADLTGPERGSLGPGSGPAGWCPTRRSSVPTKRRPARWRSGSGTAGSCPPCPRAKLSTGSLTRSVRTDAGGGAGRPGSRDAWMTAGQGGDVRGQGDAGREDWIRVWRLPGGGEREDAGPDRESRVRGVAVVGRAGADLHRGLVQGQREQGGLG